MCWSANVREKAEEGWILVLRMKKVGGGVEGGEYAQNAAMTGE